MSVVKWILGGLGFVLSGPIGAILGAILGSMVDKGIAVLSYEREGDSPGGAYDRGGRPGTTYTRQRATVGDIRISILVLIACVMKADGRLLKSELEHVKAYLRNNYDEAGAKQALQLLKQLLERDIDPVSVSRQIGENVNYSTRLEIVHMLLDLAHIDGDFDPREQQVIQQIAAGMGLSQADYNSLAALYQKTKDPDWAYTVLEISPTATDDEVKKAYRRMALRSHPDKVAGAGEEVVKNATEKFRAVNEAYETIKTARGIK